MSSPMKAALLGNFALLTLCAAPAVAESKHGGHADSANPPWSQADAYWDESEMEEARAEVLHHHGGMRRLMVLANRLEVQDTGDAQIGVIDGQAWYGGDIHRVYVKLEAEYDFDKSEFEAADVELLWSKAVSRYFDLQAGLKYDFEPQGLTHAALGFQGLAPYWFEVNGTAYLSDKGDLTASFEAEYELLISQRLILQPRLEVGFAGSDIPEKEIGAGLTKVSTGMRLRYEISREFAPYIGVEWQSAFGETANRIEANGEEAEHSAILVGIRAWY